MVETLQNTTSGLIFSLNILTIYVYYYFFFYFSATLYNAYLVLTKLILKITILLNDKILRFKLHVFHTTYTCKQINS